MMRELCCCCWLSVVIKTTSNSSDSAGFFSRRRSFTFCRAWGVKHEYDLRTSQILLHSCSLVLFYFFVIINKVHLTSPSCLWVRLSAPDPIVAADDVNSCGLFLAADQYTFGDIVSIWGSRMTSTTLDQTAAWVFMVMKACGNARVSLIYQVFKLGGEAPLLRNKIISGFRYTKKSVYYWIRSAWGICWKEKRYRILPNLHFKYLENSHFA